MGSEEYHKQLQQEAFEKSLQVPSYICRCLNTFRNLATSRLLKMLKKKQPTTEKSKRHKKDKFLFFIGKMKGNANFFNYQSGENCKQ